MCISTAYIIQCTMTGRQTGALELRQSSANANQCVQHAWDRCNGEETHPHRHRPIILIINIIWNRSDSRRTHTNSKRIRCGRFAEIAPAPQTTRTALQKPRKCPTPVAQLIH